MVIGIICFVVFILFCIIMTTGCLIFMERKDDEDQTSL